MLKNQPVQWMVVYTTYSLPEGYIVAGRLESEGIPAMVHQMPGANALGIRVGNLGQITILVREDDYGRALMILEPDAPALLPDEDDDIITIELDEDGDDEL